MGGQVLTCVHLSTYAWPAGDRARSLASPCKPSSSLGSGGVRNPAFQLSGICKAILVNLREGFLSGGGAILFAPAPLVHWWGDDNLRDVFLTGGEAHFSPLGPSRTVRECFSCT